MIDFSAADVCMVQVLCNDEPWTQKIKTIFHLKDETDTKNDAFSIDEHENSKCNSRSRS